MSRADDARFLGLALDLASEGCGWTSPNPMVGALVVRDGEILGRGYHPRLGDEHAEVLAIREAGDRAAGATLYSSLEPCAHHGRTPPCVDRILASRIRRVVACTEDPNPLVNGRGLSALREGGIRVDVGTLADEARLLNEAYFHFLATGRPLVTVKAGTSLDGRIAASEGRSRWITSSEARGAAMRLRNRHDAVLVGVGTVIADDPLLSVREPARARPVVRVVLDSKLRTPPRSRLLDSPEAGAVLIYHADGAAESRARPLRREGVGVVAAGRGPKVDLDRVLADLADRHVQSVLVEGGGEVIGSFLGAHRVDRVQLFIAPLLLGSEGVALAHGLRSGRPDEGVRIEGLRTRRIGPDLLVEGRPAAP